MIAPNFLQLHDVIHVAVLRATAAPVAEPSALQQFLDQPYVLPLLKIVGALLIIVLGLRVGRWLANLERSVLLRAHVDEILAEFLRNISYAALLALIVITALEFSGFPTASLFAVLGAAGLAVGLALKDSLANIAAGVLLIVLRPFRVGDSVKIGGQEGVIDGVFIFQTRLHTFDNRDLMFLNSQVIAAPIFNYSQRTTRRSDITLTFAHDVDLTAVITAMQKLVAADSRIPKDPATLIAISDITDRGIVFAVQFWSDASVMGSVRSDFLQNLQQALPANAAGFARSANGPVAVQS